MMASIRAGKPADSFYFTESVGEVYMKNFDGFLTWQWTSDHYVPAYSRIYSGYIEMIGRYTDGAERANDDYFRYHLTESLFFGQILGWLNASIVYNEVRLPFLKGAVALRVKYNDLFHRGHVLRPAKIVGQIPTRPAKNLYGQEISLKQYLTATWESEDGKRIVLFLANLTDRTAKIDLTLPAAEYGIRKSSAGQTFRLAPRELRAVEYCRTESK